MFGVPVGQNGSYTVGHMMKQFICEGIGGMEVTDKDSGEKTYYVEGIFMQGDVLNNNKRVYPTSILEKAVEDYHKTKVVPKTSWGELGHPDCNFLSDEEVKDFYVLTSNRGWVAFRQLTLSDEILTYNIESGILEKDEIDNIVDEKYEGVGYRLSGRGIELDVTPRHRFLCKDKYGKIQYVKIEDIYENRVSGGKKYEKYKILKIGTEWIGTDMEYVTIPGISEEEYNQNYWKYKEDVRKPIQIPTMTFVQFLGIWLSEGFVVKDNKRDIGIVQNKGDVCEKIRQLLNDFPLDFYEVKNNKKTTFKTSDVRLGRYLSELGNCYTKYIPYAIKQLPPQYLAELIYWFNLGDGRFDESSGSMRRNICSVSRRLIEDLHECLIKSGGSGNWQEFICEEDYVFADHIIKAENKKPLYQLSISTTSGIYLDQRFLKIEKINKSGNAVCLQMKNNANFYMKYKGKSYWTGNSPKINLDKVAILVEDLNKRGNDFYGRARVCHEDCPMGKILRGLLKTGGRVGVSSRGLGSANPASHNGEDCNLVDTFNLRAIDVVADPSAPNAMVEAIYEEKQYILDDSSDTVIELNEETYKIFESSIAVLPVKEDPKQEQVFEAIKNFLSSLRENTK